MKLIECFGLCLTFKSPFGYDVSKNSVTFKIIVVRLIGMLVHLLTD